MNTMRIWAHYHSQGLPRAVNHGAIDYLIQIVQVNDIANRMFKN